MSTPQCFLVYRVCFAAELCCRGLRKRVFWGVESHLPIAATLTAIRHNLCLIVLGLSGRHHPFLLVVVTPQAPASLARHHRTSKTCCYTTTLRTTGHVSPIEACLPPQAGSIPITALLPRPDHHHKYRLPGCVVGTYDERLQPLSHPIARDTSLGCVLPEPQNRCYSALHQRYSNEVSA